MNKIDNLGYVILQREFITNSVFSPNNARFRLFIFLVTNCDNKTGKIKISLQTLSEQLNISLSVARYSLFKLRKSKLISIASGKGSDANTIKIKKVKSYQSGKSRFVKVSRWRVNNQIIKMSDIEIYLLFYYHSICDVYTNSIGKPIKDVAFSLGINYRKIHYAHHKLIGYNPKFVAYNLAYELAQKKPLFFLCRLDVLEDSKK